jgi:hypothetical protein
LEPEAASIYCQLLPIEKLQGAAAGFTMSRKGTKSMIIDLGGIYFSFKCFSENVYCMSAILKIVNIN